eukprot:TRINITY_DN7482_c0_g1_i3.p1 TRINITY_DN7482_c0_g1~~TRINITY_DN7482_c0_g1_i3.p1  ORF type:complete len:192 (-),score=40.07 TRINITY_DN7482_c0_g1_i3:124-660(-)
MGICPCWPKKKAPQYSPFIYDDESYLEYDSNNGDDRDNFNTYRPPAPVTHHGGSTQPTSEQDLARRDPRAPSSSRPSSHHTTPQQDTPNYRANSSMDGAQFTQSMFMHRAGELEDNMDSSVMSNPLMRDSMVTASIMMNRGSDSVYYDAPDGWDAPTQPTPHHQDEEGGGAFILPRTT